MALETSGNVNPNLYPSFDVPISLGFPTNGNFGRKNAAMDGISITQSVGVVDEKGIPVNFPDSEAVPGDFYFGVDQIRTASANGDPFVPTMQARSVFAWNYFWSKRENTFVSRDAAWAFGLKLQFIGVFMSARDSPSQPTFYVSRLAHHTLNHWAPNDQAGLFCWFHLEVVTATADHTRFQLRLQPYSSMVEGPIHIENKNFELKLEPVRRYKVGTITEMDAVDNSGFAGDLSKELAGMPTKLLKAHDVKADNWVDDTGLNEQDYRNRLASLPRINKFIVRGSLYYNS